jgi:predicted nuclease of predicted toxin-antitoxin system
MRFLLDEGLPHRLAAFLIALGHDVTAVGHDYPFSLADRAILEIARTEQRIVLTNDKDFGDLIFRDKLPHRGVILFRLGYVPLSVRTALMQRVLDEHADELDQFIVVTLHQIRVRRSSDQSD